RRPRASCRSDRSALLAPAPETGGSWLAAGCASICRWNAKIRPTNHARSRRLGADGGARRTAPPGSPAPRQLTYGPLYALSARGGQLYVFADRKTGLEQEPGIKIVPMPHADRLIAPIVYTVPLQLLAYHVAVLKGTDVDQPRNLAKSVTVE